MGSALRWFVVFVVVLLGVELATRLDDRMRFGTPITSEAVTLADLFVSDSTGPHARAGTWFRHFRIDSIGFRGRDRSRAELDGARIVVTAGASETFGLYESPSREWPRQLEDSLRQLCFPGSPPIVLNSAFAGMSLPVVTSDLLRRVKGFGPDIVIYYPTPLQYLDDLAPKAPTIVAGAGAGRLSATRSRAWPRVREAIKASTPLPVLNLARELSTARARASSVPFDSMPLYRLALFERDLRELVGTIRSIGATPILVVHSHRFGRGGRLRDSEAERRSLTAWVRFYPRATGEQLLAFDRLAADRTIRVGQDSSIIVVDPRHDLGLREPEDVFADFSHFTDLGAALIASKVAHAVEGLLPCDRPRSSREAISSGWR